MAFNSQQFSARNDAIFIGGFHDVATETSAETTKLEGKLDALVNLITIEIEARHLIEKIASNSQQFSARNDAIFIRGAHDVAIDTSAETRKSEGKLDALMNMVTQLAGIQKSDSNTRVFVIRFSNDHHTNTTITIEARHLIKKIASNSQQFNARNDAIFIRGVHDVATDTSAETRKPEGKLDALMNLVTQLAGIQKSDSIAIQTTTTVEARHLIKKMASNSQQFGTRNNVIVIRGVHDVATETSAETRKLGVHDVATDTSAETRKLEGKLDALVNLVTQLAVNQKPTSVARVFGIADHHNSRGQTLDIEMASNFQQFSARNVAIFIRGVHDMATDTSAETRKLEGKLDAFVNLVTQLAVIQKSISVARVFGIRSSNDHYTNVCPSSQQSGVNEHP
ncbi:hypothetical protein Fmac_008355 [Flemingia macrophylla]|uniref:Uncharacterized protein n=1 Tax=Flemingia macrophylla TaxID=520843 RepID=A0ABD1MZJ4_9FABA